jgi:serine/threonine protein kinase
VSVKKVTRVITDTSFTIYHEHFKTDFRAHRIPDNENLDAWVNCQTHSNIVTCLDNFKAKGPDGQVRHFSMTETSSEGHSNPNMYQFIESLNLNLAIDVPRYYLELIYDMGIQLATALDFAHNSGLVHGQLDLSKVVIQKEGDNLIFKITDFAPTS